jgi:tetratricopeptide (TPR) repeat protein
MATYKKRGYRKPKEKVEDVVNDDLTNDVEGYVEGESTTEEVFNTLDESANKAEEWVADNQKYIFGVVGVIALGVLLFMAYGKFIQEPNEAEASNDAYKAQSYFAQAVNATGTAKDSLFNLALNGGEGKLGLLDVIENYSGTQAANLANYTAGMAYLNMNDYQNAVTYLDKFSSDDEILAANAKGGVADAFVQLNQLEDALTHYEKALETTTNEYSTPKFLYKAAVVALDLGKNDVAATYLSRIKDEFPTSLEVGKVDALLGKAQAK